mmetsp:Transcript_4016/g.7506  ORF Transcript_4016/g.7506 Transcript_4016/m.7506 type:complete len:136 (-) Transcript_4016:493-900(-)|eukprot:CAMPEP_0114251736 /NCGR_PEP_ID=MMETSP0058-20121206/15437_1 /TAXON_ID=36894 /ORGANISM="Pyramimonas parkeae, CCMP726" /LENGTH=135 /DNA_ID=CAMNT_0001365573 /DNA_START=59 /DNA_END=466 /DNA_ORIENTATION=-
MDQIKVVITKNIPTYLSALPIPESLEDVKALKPEDLQMLAPFVLVLTIFLVQSIRFFLWLATPSSASKPPVVNQTIQKDKDKVVDSINMKDYPDVEKLVFCRCWKSSKWPMCDGSHVKHNKETGDNTGPLIVNKN